MVPRIWGGESWCHGEPVNSELPPPPRSEFTGGSAPIKGSAVGVVIPPPPSRPEWPDAPAPGHESWGRTALPAGQDARTAGLLSPSGKSVSGPALEAKYNKINPALQLGPRPAARPLPALSGSWGQPRLGLGGSPRAGPSVPPSPPLFLTCDLCPSQHVTDSLLSRLSQHLGGRWGVGRVHQALGGEALWEWGPTENLLNPHLPGAPELRRGRPGSFRIGKGESRLHLPRPGYQAGLSFRGPTRFSGLFSSLEVLPCYIHCP